MTSWTRVEDPRPSTAPAPSALLVDVIEPPPLLAPEGVESAAVEFEARVPPSGQLTVCSGRQAISLHEFMAGRLVRI